MSSPVRFRSGRSISSGGRAGWKSVMVAALAVSVGLGLTPAVAIAQTPPKVVPKKDKDKDKNPPSKPSTATPPAAAGKSFLDGVLTRAASRDWLQRVSIHLDSYQDPLIYTLPSGGNTGAGQPGVTTPLTIIEFNFSTAAVVFPAIKRTATSELTYVDTARTRQKEVTAKLQFDNRTQDTTATLIENLPCGARYGRWDMQNLKGRTVDLDVELPVTTWDVNFDEALAAKAIWPPSGRWPRDAQTSLGPQFGINVESPLLQETLTKWCAGKPPQSIPPVQLAKFLAARVIDTLQPSGDGLVSSRTGLLQGFHLRGAEATLQDGRGSPHDIAGVLCALYRVAGLPARIVIGYDVSESKDNDIGLKRRKGGDIRSWVEFAVVDETVKTADGEPTMIWIPVDVIAMRKSSSKAPALERPWKFFGNNDESEYVIPISFHFHPPLTGTVAHGSSCFWGWMTTPETQMGEQMVRFTVIGAPKTGTPKPGSGYK